MDRTLEDYFVVTRRQNSSEGSGQNGEGVK